MAPPPPSTVRGTFTVAASGDTIGPNRPVTPLQEPGLDEVFAHFRQADVGYANHEGSSFNLSSFRGAPAAENGGGYPLYDPAATRDLKTLGIDLVSKANNHATDWGLDGMLATAEVLKHAGLAFAGIGTSRAAAQRPGYFETAKGRVALISLSSTFSPMGRAGEAGGFFAARPGLFAYRVTPINLVTAPQMELIRAIAEGQGASDQVLGGRARMAGSDVVLGGERFRLAEETGLDYEINPMDRADLLRNVRFAKQTADFVIVAVHSHETRSGGDWDRRPPRFLVDLYHDCIDSGADLGLTTGVHVVRGAEIYRGKPILYGLASLFLDFGGGYGFEPEAVLAGGEEMRNRTPVEMFFSRLEVPDEWYDGVVATTEFRDGILHEVRLHPLRLDRREGFRGWGTPRPARGQDALRILHQCAGDSADLGTEVDIQGGEAVIHWNGETDEGESDG